MKRLLVLVFVFGLLLSAAAFSSNLQKTALSDLFIQQEDRNPWTHLRLNNDPNDFQFVVVSDRTGGHRESVFSRAVEQINLMQPEFVLSVGDLIEGYSKDAGKLNKEWKEFHGYVSRLDLPFFYCPGNHDVANDFQEQLWKEKFGRRYYHFVYRNVLFLMLNADDPPGKDGAISAEQQTYFKKALDENRDARWTIVALHKPLWSQANVDKNGWLDMEKLLNGRPYTVFAGHVHRYHKFVRNGQNYYQLATTGGGSKLRGVRYGEFDQIVWVTMKKDGPLLANVMLDGIYPEDMRKPLTEEPGVLATRKATQPTQGKLYFEGAPAANAQVSFWAVDAAQKKFTKTGDAFADADGSFTLSTYNANDGSPVGEYAVTVVWRQPWLDRDGKPGPNLLPARYAKAETSDLRVKVQEGTNDFTLELKK